ncbi:cation-translocating P-type ATPase [Nitrospira sp. Kam-Ns4a]
MDVREFTSLSPADALGKLGSGPAGLTSEEARRCLARDGPNSLPVPQGPSLARKLLRQFTHLLAILLWFAAGLAFIADALRPGEGMATIGWAILGVILVNALFTFVQEYKAERAVEALRALLPATAWVLRAGQPQEVLREELVVGDVLLLEEGEQVPADARVIEAIRLRADTSSLTGESHPRTLKAEPVPRGALTDPLHAPNLVYAGTTILSGRGRAVVFATGSRTEFGRIAHLAGAVEPGPSPLQKEITWLTHIVALAATSVGAACFLIGVLLGWGFWVSFVFGIGILVANVPEGLLPTVTLALAMGGQRMARRKALIKHLASVETLGCTTVICTDKTGTLTENRMRVARLYAEGTTYEVREGHLLREGRLVTALDGAPLARLIEALALCNDARRVRGPDGHVILAGDPTEVALREFADRRGGPDRNHHGRMGELPFDADRKRMTTLHWVRGRLLASVKGAPELLLPLCTSRSDGSTVRPMTAVDREAVLAQGRRFAGEAYRVLAFASRDIDPGMATHLTPETVERDLTFLGLVALLDPPRPEVPDTVARCKQAGIRVIMITGDHPLTALAIARQVGLAPPGAGLVVEGAQLDVMDDAALSRLVDPGRAGGPPVFARMAPRHKLRVVAALKAKGEVVAVTGDGVNDAPALKQADIGIAMGRAGTDVAKETADMILLDDHFATIVNAVEEGRAVYANIRKFVTYVLSHLTPELVPYVAYGLFAIPLPLTVPQILAVDLGTDILPALGLGAEAPHPGIMQVPPRPRTERLLSFPRLLRAYAFLGLIEAAAAMGAFFWFLHTMGWRWGQPLDWADPLYRQATTVTLAAIVVAQIANVFACRSERLSVFRLGFLSNRFILWGILAELALLAAIVYTDFGQAVFGTGALPPWAWGPLLFGAALLLCAEELRKAVVRRLPCTRCR